MNSAFFPFLKLLFHRRNRFLNSCVGNQRDGLQGFHHEGAYETEFIVEPFAVGWRRGRIKASYEFGRERVAKRRCFEILKCDDCAGPHYSNLQM